MSVDVDKRECVEFGSVYPSLTEALSVLHATTSFDAVNHFEIMMKRYAK